jgi:hypothetical protein
VASHNIDNIAALEVSGEAVEAEFEKYLRQLISPRDFKGDLERLIYQICRRANPRKGFEKDCMRINRYSLSEELHCPIAETTENYTRAAF